ncbi:hypothetical protein [Blastococcus sp. SYSU D00695]
MAARHAAGGSHPTMITGGMSVAGGSVRRVMGMGGAGGRDAERRRRLVAAVVVLVMLLAAVATALSLVLG